MNTKRVFEVTEVGVVSPTHIPVDDLVAGDVGYIAASVKDIRSARVGDTITLQTTLQQLRLKDIKRLHLWFTAEFTLQKARSMKM